MNLFSQYKNKWWEKREQSLKAEFAVKEAEIIDAIESKRLQLEAEKDSLIKIAKENDLYEKLVQDRREELEKSHKELKDQIRLIEAKAKPDSVWITAFTSGFEKAWEMMLPIMSSGFDKIKDKIRNDAIEQTIKGMNQDVDKAVAKRIESMELNHVKTANEIHIKIKDLESRIELTQDKSEITQLKNYINALHWILNDNKKVN